MTYVVWVRDADPVKQPSLPSGTRNNRVQAKGEGVNRCMRALGVKYGRRLTRWDPDIRHAQIVRCMQGLKDGLSLVTSDRVPRTPNTKQNQLRRG